MKFAWYLAGLNHSALDSYCWAVVPFLTVDTIRTRPPLSSVAMFDSQ